MELINTKVCLKLDLGVNENMFGGRLLELIDEGAASYACEVCNTRKMVTKKIEEVSFDAPIKEGDIIKIYGEVDNIGNTSITIRITVSNIDVYNKGKINRTVCKTKMVFVKIDDDGRPSPIDQSVKDWFTQNYQK